ncbi:MAG: sigma-54 dependent transcriptional regulator [Verrucomicrobiales bacterium]
MDILIVDDERSIRESTLIAVEAEGHYAETADCREVALQRLREENFQLMMLDLRLGSESGLEVLKDAKELFPNLPVVVFTAHASIETAVEATRLGALDYLEKPFSPDQLRAVLARAQKFQKMEHKIAELETEVSTTAPPNEFESADTEMRRAYEMLFRAAPTGATVLILGESGTGKSVVAKAVHENSHLKVKPFVTVSCPSLSKELLESELFGHVKGAFTGAVKDTWGKVKAAEGGTLFLDEIGELPLEIQPKLLRLLQEKEYERVGENKARKSDVRIIAATNRNLQECVRAGQFREDLFYRLNVISVEMPPLRARPEDLRRFAQNYLQFFAGQMKRAIIFHAGGGGILDGIRPPQPAELRNAIERATRS